MVVLHIEQYIFAFKKVWIKETHTIKKAMMKDIKLIVLLIEQYWLSIFDSL